MCGVATYVVLREQGLLWRFGRKLHSEDVREQLREITHSLDICSQAFYRVFACAIIHTAKRRIGLVLRSGAIHSVGTI
jgi:hypothetical protein